MDPRSLLLEALLSQASEAIFMKDREGRYLVANEIAARALGHPPGEVIGKRDDELLPPEYARPIMDLDRRILDTGAFATVEDTVPCPAGPRVWSVGKGLVRGEGGDVIGIFGVGHDVTEERRRHAEEREARLHAERMAAQLEALKQVTDTALAALGGDLLIRELLDRIRRLFDADTSTLLLLREHEHALEVSASVGLEKEVDQQVKGPIGQGFAGTVAATRRPLVLDDVAHHQVVSPVLRQAGVRSMAGVPVAFHGRLLGVVHVGTLTPRAFGPDDVRLLQVVADRIAVVLENLRLLRAERDARVRSEGAEERYRALVNGLDRAMVWEADAHTLWFTFVSKQAEELLGLPLSDWFSQPNFLAEHLDPADRERVLGILRDAAADEQVRNVDHRLIRAGGEAVWVHTRVTVSRRSGAKVLHGLSMDITDLKRSEEMLRSRVRQLAAMAELSERALAGAGLPSLFDEVVARVARELDVDLVSILELTPERDRFVLRAGVGWHAGRVGHATVSAGSDSLAAYTRSVGLPVVVDDLRADTRFRPSSLLVEHGSVSGMSVVISCSGEVFGILGAYNRARRPFTGDDVAFLQSIANLLSAAVTRSRLIVEVEKTARERQELNAVVAHDLRNSVTTILLTTDSLERAKLDERGKRGVGRLRTAANAMDALIRSVLDAGAIEAGRLNVDKGPCDPAAAIREAVEALAPLAEARNLDLDADLPDSLPPIVCDKDRLLQVFSNLLGNALKFTKQGRIRISAGAWDDEVVFSVTDTGPGIEAKDLSHVFERFWQVEKTARKGSGLGLFIVKGIVEAHGGRVWAESVVGEGATFFVALPKAA